MFNHLARAPGCRGDSSRPARIGNRKNYPNSQSLIRPASGSAELPLANSVRRWLRQRGAHRGAMAEYLDSFLDFISIELLGCALPRQRRVEPAVTEPVHTVCRVAVCAPRPLRTVLYVLRRRAAAARGWDAPHALLVLRRLALVHIGARWSTSSNRVARATKCLTHPCDLWHHRPSNRRSRSTETQLPRGAMVMSSVDKTRARRSAGAVRAASCVPYGPKA